MPWEVTKRDDVFVVVVSAGPKKGKVVSRHRSKADAVKKVKAMYANVPEGKHKY